MTAKGERDIEKKSDWERIWSVLGARKSRNDKHLSMEINLYRVDESPWVFLSYEDDINNPLFSDQKMAAIILQGREHDLYGSFKSSETGTLASKGRLLQLRMRTRRGLRTCVFRKKNTGIFSLTCYTNQWVDERRHFWYHLADVYVVFVHIYITHKHVFTYN